MLADDRVLVVVVVVVVVDDMGVLLVSMVVLLPDNVLSLIVPFGFVLLGELNTLEGALEMQNLLVGVDLGEGDGLQELVN